MELTRDVMEICSARGFGADELQREQNACSADQLSKINLNSYTYSNNPILAHSLLIAL